MSGEHEKNARIFMECSTVMRLANDELRVNALIRTSEGRPRRALVILKKLLRAQRKNYALTIR